MQLFFMKRTLWQKYLLIVITINSIGLTSATKSMAQPYSIRNAFCTDYASARSNIQSSTFFYDLQVAYNACMSRASELIRDSENQKRRNEAESRIQYERYQREQRERAKKDEIESQRIRYEEQVKKEQEIDLERQAEARRLEMMQRINNGNTFEISPYK